MKTVRLLTLFLACAGAASVSGCFKPPRSMPDQSTIGFDGRFALPPDCASLSRPSVLTDAGWHRPSMEWGCATYSNLAAQIANPQDLVKPQPLGPADAAVAASAVRRYETGHVIPLDTATSRDSK
ncbi:CpaD family pilus assembly lipoprotein [Paraburkholderia aromaticivorans]|uniref:CpaD family pilus assembly lipoprotein n=1 Tax=Paraburkholderia aromaticivorans TaxID=2026199 RepID=UPI00145605CA|nr:CpaD family pilus assembly lipoprotein [Paraburkholderia aromaticivorans]